MILTGFLYLLAIWAFYQAVRSTGAHQVFPLLFGMLMIPPGVNLLSGHPMVEIVILVLLGVAIYRKQLSPAFKSFPLRIPLIILIISLFIVSVADESQTVGKNLYICTLYIIQNILPLFIFFLVFYNSNDEMRIYRYLAIMFFPICLYGIFSQLTQENPYIDAFSETFGLRNQSSEYLHNTLEGRIKTSSLFFHPYFYSVALYQVIFYVGYFVSDNIVKLNKIFLIALTLLLLINIYFTDSRTVVIALAISLSIYLLLSLTAVRFVRYLFLIPVLLIGMLQIPQVYKFTENTLDAFSERGPQVKGSSMEMRKEQYELCVKYFNQSPVVGHGLHSIQTKFGYTVKKEDRTSDKRARGFESFLFVLMVEQGALGVLSHLILFLAIAIYSLRSYFMIEGKYRYMILINLALTVGYVIYVLGTGTINSMPVFFALVGVSLSMQRKLRAVAGIKGLNISFS